MDANTVLEFMKAEIAKIREEFSAHVKQFHAQTASTVASATAGNSKPVENIASGFKQIK